MVQDGSFLCRPFAPVVGCPALSLTSIHWRSVTPLCSPAVSTKAVFRYFHVSSGGTVTSWQRPLLYTHPVCVCAKSLQSCLFATLWTVAPGLLRSMGFSMQDCWSGFPCPPSGDLLDPGIKPVSPAAPALQADSFPLSHWGSPTPTLTKSSTKPWEDLQGRPIWEVESCQVRGAWGTSQVSTYPL